MNPTEVLEELPISDWHGPSLRRLRQRAVQALENGRVLFLPDLPFRTGPDEAVFLTADAAGGERKNISLDPASGRIGNTTLPPETPRALTAMLDRFGHAAERLLHDLLPGYAPALERARTSFRPVEIAGRANLAAARRPAAACRCVPEPSAARPPHPASVQQHRPGRRRRAWRVGEPFADFRPQVPAARRAAASRQRLAAARLGLTKGRRSAYDQIMLRLHDGGKQDAPTRPMAHGRRRVSAAAPPGSASPTRCCTRRSPAIAHWSRRSICRCRRWPTRRNRRCACWSGWPDANWPEAGAIWRMAQQSTVDLALVLAIDTSGSISNERLALQIRRLQRRVPSSRFGKRDPRRPPRPDHRDLRRVVGCRAPDPVGRMDADRRRRRRARLRRCNPDRLPPTPGWTSISGAIDFSTGLFASFGFLPIAG